MDWKERQNAFARGIDFSDVPKTIDRALREPETLFVACSGGADSVFALLWTVAFMESHRLRTRVVALHLNHKLRGSDSDADAAFVRELCAGVGVELFESEANWEKDIEAVTESDAREARLEFFRNAIDRYGLRRGMFVTGHHGGDIGESILMRLSRGSGLQGLCSPREISEASGCIQFVRPLLRWTREEIRNSLRDSGISWQEDATNSGDANYRARIRKLVIPAWENASDRPLATGIARSHALLSEDHEALESIAESAWETLFQDNNSLARARFDRNPVAIQRRLLHRLAGLRSCELSANVADTILEIIDAGETAVVSLSDTWEIACENESIRLRDRSPQSWHWRTAVIPMNCVTYLPDGARITARIEQLDAAAIGRIFAGEVDNSQEVYLRLTEKPSGGIAVRRRKEGDAFKPHGKSSPQKLKTLLINRKIDRSRRDRLPIFVGADDRILWVPGLPPQADTLIDHSQQAALRLTYEG